MQNRKQSRRLILSCLIVTMFFAATPVLAGEQPQGVWTLQSAEAVGVRQYENDPYYPSHVFSLYDGGFAGQMKWQYMKDSGTVSHAASWTGFGGTLVPGDMLFACALDTRASQTAGYRNVSNQLWVYFDYTKQTDDIKNNGSTDVPIPPRNERLTLRIPRGTAGQTMKVRVACSNSAGYGEFVYNYVFGESLHADAITPVQSAAPPDPGDAPDEPGTANAGDTLPLPTGIRTANPRAYATLAPVVSPAIDSGTRFSDLGGQVEINIPLGYDANGEEIYDEEMWNFAELDAVIPYGTHIRTSRDSSAILSFADMTTFVMRPESEIVIQHKPENDNQIELLGGQLWINIKKMMKDGSMDIEMSQAVAGGRGTIFVCEETGAASRVLVLESRVIFASRIDGRSEEVLPGESLTAGADGLWQKGTFDIFAEAAAWGFDLVEISHKEIAGEEAAFSLRGVSFGMQIDQVEKTEGNIGIAPDREGETLVYRPLPLEGQEGASLVYRFYDGLLHRIDNDFSARHQDALLHIREYEGLNTALTARYGVPSAQEENWVSPYRVTADIAAALVRGDLAYTAKWELPGVAITHELFTDMVTNLITHRVIYRDPAFNEETYKNRDLYVDTSSGRLFSLRNGITFGLPPEDVLTHEQMTGIPQISDKDLLVFDALTVAGLEGTVLEYGFADGRLFNITYLFGLERQDASLQIAEYEAIERALALGYGVPAQEGKKWKSQWVVTNDLPAALMRGDLSLVSVWELPGVVITHQLFRDEAGRLSHRVDYRGK